MLSRPHRAVGAVATAFTLLVGSVALAGCSGSDRPTSGKACGLITAAEAADALGVSLRDITVEGLPERPDKRSCFVACSYYTPNELVYVDITIEDKEYRAGDEDEIVNDWWGAGAVTTKETGLGYPAASIGSDGSFEFHVWSKGSYLVVHVSKKGTTRGGLAGPARTLTEKAVARL